MTRPGHDAPDTSTRASILIVCGLIPLLALFPPETRGESMAGAAALIALLVAVRPAARSNHNALAILVAAGAALLAAAIALAPGAAVEPLAVALLALGLGLATSTLGTSLIEPVSRALVGGAVVAALHGVYQRLWGLDRLARIVAEQPALPDREAIAIRIEQGRAFAAFPTPAALGGLLAISLPVSVALALRSRGTRRAGWWSCVAIQVAALLAAASATAVAALVAALALAWLARAGAWRDRIAALVAALALLMLVVGLRDGALTDLRGPDSPWRLRAGNMRIAGEMMLDHPLLGVGPGGYGELYAQYRRPGDNETRHAHDLPLELTAEWGLPVGAGLSLAFFALFLSPLARAVRRREPGSDAERATFDPALGLSVGLAAFALHNIADFTGFLPSLLWIAAALRGALVRGSGRGASRPAAAPALAWPAFAACVVAALCAAGSGLGRNARVEARAAAFDARPADAERLVSRALTLAPWDVDGAALAARIAAADGDRGQVALERADRAVALSPVRASNRALRARVRATSGDAPGALAELEEAVRRSPHVGEYAVAAERFREALARSLADADRGGA